MTKGIPLHKALNEAMLHGNTVFTVFVDLSGQRRLGRVVQFNSKTVWVMVRKGARTYDTIKRHQVKHRMAYRLKNREGKYEVIHPTTWDKT